MGLTDGIFKMIEGVRKQNETKEKAKAIKAVYSEAEAKGNASKSDEQKMADVTSALGDYTSSIDKSADAQMSM